MNRPRQLDRRILLLEILIVLSVVAYYEVGNLLFRPDVEKAYENAVALWRLEQATFLDFEPGFQRAFGAFPPVLWALIFFYVGPHFGLTLGFVAWAFWYRFPSYPEVRDSFVAFTLGSFGYQWIVPLSPPRYVPESGLRDSIAETLPINGNTPWIQEFSNPHAALPSVHFGWALLVALLATRLLKSPKRWWWYAYPATIGTSILATGNHWTLDLVLAAVFLVATEAALALRRREWSTVSSAPLKASASAPP